MASAYWGFYCFPGCNGISMVHSNKLEVYPVDNTLEDVREFVSSFLDLHTEDDANYQRKYIPS
jgi:hypothetical protein